MAAPSQTTASRDRKAWQILVTSDNESNSAEVECESESQLLLLKPFFSRRRSSGRALRPKKNLNCKNNNNKSVNASTTTVPPTNISAVAHEYFVTSKNDNPPVTSKERGRPEREAKPIASRPVYELKNNANDSTPVLMIKLDGQNETLLATRSELSVQRTKVILKPLAKSKAGRKGTAISSPISTVFVKRGDYVEIEYLPEAIADVGEDGTAISRPELFIHFVDRRRK